MARKESGKKTLSKARQTEKPDKEIDLDIVDKFYADAKKTEKVLDAPSFSERQSVRTTFKLYQRAIDDLEWLSKYFRITIKEVLDTLIRSQYEVALWKMVYRYSKVQKDRESINVSKKNKTSDTTEPSLGNLVRKTYVVSKGSVRLLNKWAREFDVSRDYYISSSANTYRKEIEEHQARRHDYYEKYLDLIIRLSSEAGETAKKLNDEFRKGRIFWLRDWNYDPVPDVIDDIITQLDELNGWISEFLKDGTDFEYDDFEIREIVKSN